MSTPWSATMYGAVKPTFACRAGVIVIAAIAKSHGFGPFATSFEKSGSLTKRTVFTPSRAASARASSGSRPLLKTTFVPCTEPAWRPGLGRLSATVTSPGTFVGGAAADDAPASASAGDERGGERPHRDVPSTVTGVPTGMRS